MKLILSCLLSLGFFTSSIVIAQSHYTDLLDQKETHQHLSFLASDSLGGRGAGELGQKKAADYIQRHFKSIGLKPVATDYHGNKIFVQEYSFMTYHDYQKTVTINKKNIIKTKTLKLYMVMCRGEILF